MACSNCTKAKSIIVCGNFLLIQIGLVAGTQYTIYLKNVTLDIIYKQSATVDLTGKLYFDFDLFDSDIYMSEHTFEMWVTLKNDGIDNHITLTYVGETATCLEINFVNVWDENDEPVTPYNIQYIELV